MRETKEEKQSDKMIKMLENETATQSERMTK